MDPDYVVTGLFGQQDEALLQRSSWNSKRCTFWCWHPCLLTRSHQSSQTSCGKRGHRSQPGVVLPPSANAHDVAAPLGRVAGDGLPWVQDQATESPTVHTSGIQTGRALGGLQSQPGVVAKNDVWTLFVK